MRTDKFERLAGTFVHAFRNAVDHGIEPSEDREMLGKPPEGELNFRVETFDHEGQAWIRFLLEDDGQGIHVDQIKDRLSQSES